LSGVALDGARLFAEAQEAIRRLRRVFTIRTPGSRRARPGPAGVTSPGPGRVRCRIARGSVSVIVDCLTT
jgi:hypothetical protein